MIRAYVVVAERLTIIQLSLNDPRYMYGRCTEVKQTETIDPDILFS